MKKNNKWLISLFTIFIFLCVSCNNFLSRETQKEVEKTAAQTKTGRLSFNVNGVSSRSVLPDTSIQNFTDFVLTGSVEGNNNTQNLGSWSNVQDLLSASITIATGTWNLTLSAKRDTVDFAARAQVTIEEGQNATASFKLSAVQISTGIANITLRFPANRGICAASWTFYDDGAYDTFWYTNGDEIEGFCYIDESHNESDISCEQTITDSSFSLKAALPAGRYRFRCEFGTEITGVGDYYDFIVIQPGFESVLDYTIDYFEFTGITDAVSTEQGMQLTLVIPKGVQNLEIMRIKDYAGLMQAQNNPDPNVEPPDIFANTTIITKKLDARTTSQTTLQLLDSYGYEAGDELTYGVYFDMNSMGSVIKTFTASHDGIPVPEFTSYPEFATESNDQGITSKIIITNNPVLDWKGHELSSGYKLYLSDDTMMGTFFPEVVVDSTTKEYIIEEGTLNPGQTSFTLYRLGLDSNGLSYSLYLNTKNLTGAQLPPVLQGPSPAQATDEGIHILLYPSGQDIDGMIIFRSTSLDDPWNVIEDDLPCDYKNGQYCLDYTDKYDLVAGTTYYYKVVDRRGKSYGGEYFSATATVTKGPYASITTQPVLAVSNDAVASFTPGSLQFAEPDKVGSVTIAYEYIQQDNSNIKLTIDYTKYTGNDNYSFQGNYTGDLWANVWAYDQSLDLYNYQVNGNKFSFSKAYILIKDKNYNTLRQLDFTPAQGSCPSEIQIPNKKIGLTATPTSDGIVLSITNISEGVNYLEIRSSDDINNIRYEYNNNRSYYYSNGEGLANSLTHTDKYVDGNKEYYYLVTAGNYRSDIISITSTGGSGELWVSSYPAGELGLNESGDEMITFTQAGQLTIQDLPENTSWYLEFEYRSYLGNGKPDNTMWLHYSGSQSNYSNTLGGDPGLYEPYSVRLGVTFPDYSYSAQKNVSTFAPMPQQITID